MRQELRLFTLAVLAGATLASAIAQDPPALPTWNELTEQGIAPYRQLTVADFPVDDSVQANFGFYIKPAIQPHYRFGIKPHGSFTFAYVEQWRVFSGFHKKETSRRSKFKGMKDALPFAQALLDLSEIHARQMVALKTGELPSARGETFEQAEAELRRKITEFMEARFKQARAEMEVFATETKGGNDTKKVKQLAAEIRKRLDAMPVTTVPANDAPPSGSPAPSASASPAASPSSTPAPRGL